MRKAINITILLIMATALFLLFYFFPVVTWATFGTFIIMREILKEINTKIDFEQKQDELLKVVRENRKK